MKRISGYINEDLFAAIHEVAKLEKRKFTPTIEILLEYAIKQKNRKRVKKNNKEVEK